jgi:hypothetical protein
MRSTTEINKEIIKNQQQIRKLEKRAEGLDADLQAIKDKITEIPEKKYKKEITDITSTREVVKESIQDRRNALEALEIEFREAKSTEAREDAFNSCAKLTKKAEANRKRQNELVKKFDKIAGEIIGELADINADWKNTVSRFLQHATSLEPTFRAKANDKLTREEQAERETIRNELLERIEDKAGVSSGAARLEGYVLSWRDWNNLSRKVQQESSEFGAYDLMRRLSRKRAKKAERKQQRQMEKLQKEAKKATA